MQDAAFIHAKYSSGKGLIVDAPSFRRPPFVWHPSSLHSREHRTWLAPAAAPSASAMPTPH